MQIVLLLLLLLIVPLKSTFNSGICDAIINSVNEVFHRLTRKPEKTGVPLTRDICRTKLFPKMDDLFTKARDCTFMICPQSLANENAKNDFLQPTAEACAAKNWQLGSNDESGKACAPEGGQASWTDVPAILGFNDAIDNTCGYSGPVNDWLKRPIKSLNRCCMKSRKYYNRLFLGVSTLGVPHWTLCQNMMWLQCAAQGFLPGQSKGSKGGKIYFPAQSATVAAQLLIEPHDTKQSVGVTVHEICMLDRLCTNSDELWTIPGNTLWECAYSNGAFQVSKEESLQQIPDKESAVSEEHKERVAVSIGGTDSSSFPMILVPSLCIFLYALYCCTRKDQGDSVYMLLPKCDKDFSQNNICILKTVV